jgi:hypothetical protein
VVHRWCGQTAYSGDALVGARQWRGHNKLSDSETNPMVATVSSIVSRRRGGVRLEELG